MTSTKYHTGHQPDIEKSCKNSDPENFRSWIKGSISKTTMGKVLLSETAGITAYLQLPLKDLLAL